MELQIALQLCLLLCLFYFGTSIRPPVNLVLNNPSNMLYYNGSLFIGAMDKLLEIDEKKFSVIQNGSTCVDLCVDVNHNKVLLLNKQQHQLITCGTANEGRCEIRGIRNLNTIIKRSGSGGNDDFKIPVSLSSPVQAFVDDNSFIPFAMSDRSVPLQILDTNFTLRSIGIGGRTITFLGNYSVKFKAAFHHNGFYYFFTNQKRHKNSMEMVSKIIRICSNDASMRSYIDTILSCSQHGVVYNILQDVALLQTDVRTLHFVAAFTKQLVSDSGSILCTISFDKINEEVNQAKIKFVVNKTGSGIDESDHYLKEDIIYNLSNETEAAGFLKPEFLCKEDSNNMHLAVGANPIELDYAASTSKSDGWITKLHSTMINGFPVLVAGTGNVAGLKPSIIKYVLDDGKLLRYHSFNVTLTGYKDEVKALYQKNETDHSLFVMTSKGVEKFGTEEDCNSYEGTDCKTIDFSGRKNPLCGWCVFKQRVTLKSECSTKKNHWLSPLGSCLSANLHPKAVSINHSTSNVTINISIPYLPTESGSEYKCSFGDTEEVNAQQFGEIFSCQLRMKTEHSYEMLKFKVNTTVIAEEKFLFYDCSKVLKCGECVNIPGEASEDCVWCPLKGECKQVTDNINDTCEGLQGINTFASCPQLSNNKIYVHTDEETPIPIATMNFMSLQNNQSHEYKIVYKNLSNICTREAGENINCSFIVQSKEPYQRFNLSVWYKHQGSSKWVQVDDIHNTEVAVYSCRKLAEGKCNVCFALKDEFPCNWNNTGCVYDRASSDEAICPDPTITSIYPLDGPKGGSTKLTVLGEELGSCNKTFIETLSVNNTVNALGCQVNQSICNTTIHLKEKVRTGLICITYYTLTEPVSDGKINMYTKEDKFENNITSSTNFISKEPDLFEPNINPAFGPAMGGTVITMKGSNICIGNGRISAYVVDDNKRTHVMDQCLCLKGLSGPDTLVCTMTKTDKEPPVLARKLYLVVDDKEFHFEIYYEFKTNPTVKVIDPVIGFMSGGTIITVSGDDLKNGHDAFIIAKFDFAETKEKCEFDNNSTTTMHCPVPKAPESVLQMLNSTNSETKRRRRREACSECLSVEIVIKIDGVEKTFSLTYYHDPSFSKFDGTKLFSSKDQYLTIEGNDLNLVAGTSDYKITIGIEDCKMIEVNKNYMTCAAPRNQPKASQPGQLPEVNVKVGNIHTTLGYIQYQQELNIILIIAGASGGAAVFLLVMVIFVCKYRKVGSKAKALEKQLNNLELEIKHVAKEEFLDMQTSMSTVNRNLIEQGFPYHSYQQYACNAMFATDYLMSDPVVSSYKMSDELRARARTGMERFQGLLENKFFLVSLITTMEKQKHFFIKEKSNFAGNLCAIMMGRMDYMHEVLQVLITQLVEDPSSKRGVKSLFRRSESITEKLLSNWLSLCLYPHLKDHTGSLLYLLYIATRKTMEAGPIDALTNDAKYTLSEEKLLRKYQGSATDEETTDVKFEAKALTLNVVVDNGEEIYPCKALDCDTVNQVKAKCLDQIYVNYPASQLPVDPTELLLEWHAGFSGRMILRDKDNTSKRDGEWIRVNTLAHYAVADQSNMALVDPRNAELSQQEDYVNLAQIDPGFDVNSMGSDQPLTAECSTSHDEENPMELKQWHLLKDDDANKKEKSAIDQLYLNRLITTKLSLVKYIDDLFSLVLESSKCPPPVKFLYDFLDDLAEKQKIDPDTLHAWKSHSYSIRIWAMLIKTPSILFDINAPSYVSESLDVISQVFIESFSRTEQAVSKESPTQKLIFRNELTNFRTHVQEFYKNVKENVQKPDELGQYLTSINRNQQETTFNKNAALYRLYEQIKPYTDEILDDLSICQETRCLQLNKKIDDIFSMMEE
ncbi:plexin-A1-like isoform X1 [Mya arenaria]|uniref:plexin-A1-like isoform X1 n=1 Tax=Mya arenaria TaxID=6604 RepID=UPI0022E1B0A2|nr:plexin-A1-like isoform X1 [Mya arenaria]XP_052781275.1 plexin-A1-like isoform X1 [Mya arenaria]